MPRHYESGETERRQVAEAALRVLAEEGLLADLGLEGDPLERLVAMFRRRAAFIGANGSVGRLIFSEQLVHLPGEPGRARVVRWRSRSLDFTQRALDKAAAAGRTVPGVDTPCPAQQIQGVLLTFALQANVGAPAPAEATEARIDTAWQTLQRLLFRALPPPAPGQIHLDGP